MPKKTFPHPNPTSFSQLPSELQFEIVNKLNEATCLNPNAIKNIGRTNYALFGLTQDPIYWKNKLKQHFPFAYRNAIKKEPINWFKEFKKNYFDTYKNLSEKNKALFFYVKERNVDALRKNKPGIKTLYIKDSNDVSLIEWIAYIDDRPTLNYFFSQTLHYYQGKPPKSYYYSNNLLHWAVILNQPDVVNQLLESGMPVNIKNMMGWTPICLAATYGYNDLVKTLLSKGAELTPQDASRETPLIEAAYYGHFEIVKMIVEGIPQASQQTNINLFNSHGVTPLFCALYNGHDEIIKFLLDKGANVNIGLIENCRKLRNKPSVQKGDTVLHLAVKLGNLTILDHILKKTLNINMRNHYDYTPLHAAIEYGQMDVVKRLLNYHDININLPNHNGETPLMYAIRCNQTAIAKLLLERNPDLIHQATRSFNNFVPPIKKGDTALHVAARAGNTEIVKILLSAENQTLTSICLNTWNDSKETPYHAAKTKALKAELRLRRYLSNRNNEPIYKKSFTLFGHKWLDKPLRIFNHKFNVARAEKLNAAIALNEVDKNDISALDKIYREHKDALANGELGTIYRNFRNR